MGSYSLGENLLLGLLVLGMIFWMRPGVKATMEKSRASQSDWMGVVLPIGFVILFVIFLIVTV